MFENGIKTTCVYVYIIFALNEIYVNCSRTEFWMMKNMPNALPFISKSGIHYSWETVLEYFSHELWPPVIVAAAVFLFPSLFIVRLVDIVTIRLGQRIHSLFNTYCIAEYVFYICFILTPSYNREFSVNPLLFIVQSWFFVELYQSSSCIYVWCLYGIDTYVYETLNHENLSLIADYVALMLLLYVYSRFTFMKNSNEFVTFQSVGRSV